MTDADPQHFGSDPTDIQIGIWINPEIRIQIPDHVRLKIDALADVRSLSRRIPPPPEKNSARRHASRNLLKPPPPQFLRRAAAQVILTNCDTCSSFIMKLSNSLFGRKKCALPSTLLVAECLYHT